MRSAHASNRSTHNQDHQLNLNLKQKRNNHTAQSSLYHASNNQMPMKRSESIQQGKPN